MKNFDIFTAIDWSGAISPIHTKSIAVSSSVHGHSAPSVLIPKDNKYWSRQSVFNHILSLTHTSHRHLIGIDCNFSYAQSVVEHQLGANQNAQSLWALVDQICRDDSNFSAQSFWIHEKYKDYFWVSGTLSKNFQIHKRQVENVCGELGLGWPESPFKLIGPKQVGKGGLSGMRLVHQLKKIMNNTLAVWPYDSSEQCNQAQIVITEIYPRLFLKLSHHGSTKIRTLLELNNALKSLDSEEFKTKMPVTDHLSDALISSAGLRFLCGPGKSVPSFLSSPNVSREKLETEGWIWGVTNNQNKLS